MDVQEALEGIGTRILYTDDGTGSGGIIATPDQPHERGRAWDIRMLDIKKLARPRNEHAAALWFRGLHNIAIPDEMLDVMNPAEIAAVYVGAQWLKHRGRIIPCDKATDAIRALDDAGFPLIGGYGGWKKPLPTSPGSQLRRIEALPGRTRERFVESFMAPYNQSYTEDPAVGLYNDPEDRTAYENGIWHYLNRRWDERS